MVPRIIGLFIDFGEKSGQISYNPDVAGEKDRTHDPGRENILLLRPSQDSRHTVHVLYQHLNPLYPLIAQSFADNRSYLRYQDFVPRRNARRNPFALSVQSTRSHSEHFGLVELLDAAFRQEDAAGGFGFGFDSLHKDAVE